MNSDIGTDLKKKKKEKERRKRTIAKNIDAGRGSKLHPNAEHV